jgi:hypothetical protein
MFPVAHVIEAGMQEPRQEKHQNRLGDFGRLQGEVAAETDPAMGVVGTRNKEHQDEQQRGDAEGRVNEAG